MLGNVQSFEQGRKQAPMLGKLLWFNEDKNYGFIRTEEGERLYVHRDGFLPGEAPVGRCAGLAVSFEVYENGEERAAVAVTLVPEAQHGRARRRHSH